MVSLTTVYIVSIVLTSIAGIGSAFAAKRVTGGAIDIDIVKQVEETTKKDQPVNEATNEEPSAQPEEQSLSTIEQILLDIIKNKSIDIPTDQQYNSIFKSIKDKINIPQSFERMFMDAVDKSENAIREEFESVPELSSIPVRKIDNVITKKYVIQLNNILTRLLTEPMDSNVYIDKERMVKSLETVNINTTNANKIIDVFEDVAMVIRGNVVDFLKEVSDYAKTRPVERNVDDKPLLDAIKKGFNMNDEFVENVVAFIKTPVTEWKSITEDPSELRRKFMKTLTHENLNKCPVNLKDVCKLVAIKYSNMKNFIDGVAYQNYGDQTAEAISLLSSTE